VRTPNDFTGRLRILAAGMAVALVTHAAAAQEPSSPLLLGSKVRRATALAAAPAGKPGTAEVVVPGFSPLQTSGTVVTAGPRIYKWRNDSFMPSRLDSVGRQIVSGMNLRVTANGTIAVAKATNVRVLESTPHHAVIEATGQLMPNLPVRVTTRVEYDGVAMVTIQLTPSAAVYVDALDYEVDVIANPYTRMLKFQTADIRVQARNHVITPSYAGGFLNAIAIADGDRSFWWFADNAEGWIWNGSTVTELSQVAPDRLRLRQRLIGARYRVAGPMTMRMNWLVTPVRNMGSGWRNERVTAGNSTIEGQLGKILGWWSTAFAHTALPYTEPPAEVLSQIPSGDWANYPGLAANRTLREKTLQNRGIHALPYFSAHCLTEIDPALRLNRAQWEVKPIFPVVSPDLSYPTPFQKPALSHRAVGYTDYVVSRIDEEIDKLGMTGIYLDHASIFDSNSPAHGAWVDSNGRTQPSTDILGMRSYLKRLRTLFYEKGKPGYTMVHASNSEIVPAYSFATAIVDGEQFRHKLMNNDYIGSISLDQFRTQHAPGQYALRNLLINQLDYKNASNPSWRGSEPERRAFRNLLTLILLHDSEYWPGASPQDERLALIGALDSFGVAQSSFVGYWSSSLLATTATSQTRVSAYHRAGGLLLVVGNLSPSGQTVDVTALLAKVGLPLTTPARLVPTGQNVPHSSGRFSLSIPARDFRLVEFR
jgi:hypothetical protein